MEQSLAESPKRSIIDRTLKAAIREYGWELIWFLITFPVVYLPFIIVLGPPLLVGRVITMIGNRISYWAHDGICTNCHSPIPYKEWASHTKSWIVDIMPW